MPGSYCRTDLVSVGCCFLESVLELEPVLELLSALQVVLQSEPAAFGHGDKLVPLCLSLHKLRSPAGHQECGLILFWLTPSENGNLHCQNYWSIQWLQGVQQAADRFEPSEWEGTFCFASPAVLISAPCGWGRGNVSSWRSSCGSV